MVSESYIKEPFPNLDECFTMFNEITFFQDKSYFCRAYGKNPFSEL